MPYTTMTDIQPYIQNPETGLDNATLIRAYTLMLTSRRIDEKLLILLKQGKVFFHIGGPGHEACQIGTALALRPSIDWAYCYYRDLAFVLTYGTPIEDVFLESLHRGEAPSSGGRQTPGHWGDPKRRIVGRSSPTGTQFLQAVGTAIGAVKEGTDEVVYVSSGEGATSEGEFHEALNWASREKLPVIFLIENNRYAISVPIAQQTAGSSVYEMVKGYVGLQRFNIDGTDLIASYKAAYEAVARARRREGPSIIVADTVRLLPHSSSDDQRKYRSGSELAEDLKRDPLPKLEKHLLTEGIISQDELIDIQQNVKHKIDEAAHWAEGRPLPDPSSVLRHVYAPSFIIKKEEFEEPEFKGEKIVFVDAINHALAEELERNPKMLVYGEDVGGAKGGVFTATKGLTARFGSERVFNSPLAEASIIGTAYGLAVRGFKPVVEIQFGDYIWPAFMQLRDEVSMLRYRTMGKFSCPMVIRVPVGGYIRGGLYHSQSIEGFFTHMPGIRVVLPSNAADAKGLLKTACREEDPVLFLEHKGLYRQNFAATPEPDSSYLLPFGLARVVRKGTDITIITYGMMVQRSLEAARRMEAEGVSVEIIDLRTLNPLDRESMLASVKKNGKVLIVHEDTLTGGFGAELAAIIAGDAFQYLDAPVRRVAAKDSPVPYSPPLEYAMLPQEADISQALQELAQF
ncbi:MAG: thiamine pyrophosphate-dependent enzyme [Bacteroidota bacterium]